MPAAPSHSVDDRFDARLKIKAGDRVIRALPGGGVYRAVIGSDSFEDAERIARRGIPVEQAGPGGYVVVSEVHDSSGYCIGRRIADHSGQLLPGHRVIPARESASTLSKLDEENPPRNRYPGVTLRGGGRARVAVIDMNQLGGQSVGDLAQLFHLSSEQVMRALLSRRGNAHVVRELHNQTPVSWTSMTRARRDLRTARPYGSYRQRRDGRWVTHVVPLSRSEFRVPRGLAAPVLLPATPRLERDLATYQSWLEREQRRGELRGPLRAMLDVVATIRAYNQTLRSYADSRRDLIAPRMQDLSLLQSMNLMLAAMVQFPKISPDAEDTRDVAQFRSQLREVTGLANDIMLNNPVGYEWWTANIHRTSGELFNLLADASLAQNAAVVARHWDLVDSADRMRIEQTFLEAYRLLVSSPREDDAVRHLQPVLDALAAEVGPPSSVPLGLSPGFRAALTLSLSRSDSQTALLYLALAAGAGSRTVANLPGPNSFAVALLNVVGPTLMGRISDPEAAGRLGGLVYRALVAVTRLDADEAGRLLRHVAQGNHQGMSDARELITSKWPGRSTGGLLVLLNLTAMLNVWVSNEHLTLRNWADLIGSGISATLGVARILATLDRLEDARILTSLTRGAGGRALGLLGSALAIYSGTELAITEYRSGDITGALLAGADVLGGTVSVVGFLMAAGAANAWNGVGEVLMLIGAIIGLVSFIWSSLREYFTAGPKRVAEGMLEQFRRNGGAYDLLLITVDDMPADSQRRVRQLRQQVDALASKLNDTDFWNVSQDGAETLLNLDFCPPHIAILTDEDEDDVIRLLRRRNRWNAVDRRRCRQQDQPSSDALPLEQVRLADAGANRRLGADEVRYLVLEGGGGKGLVFLGALRGLERVRTSDGGAILAIANGRLRRIRGVAGASAGAITALGLSCGMSATAIDRISNPRYKDFDDFFDLPERSRKVPSIGSNCVTASTPDVLRTLIFDPMEALLRRTLPRINPLLTPLAARASATAARRAEQLLYHSAVQGLRRDDSLAEKLASRAMLYYARNLWQDLGFFSGCNVRAFLDDVIVRQGGTRNMTFAEHLRVFGVKLVVTGSNLESGQTEMFSADHTPQMPVADAVRISLSLPVLFKPVRITVRKAREITRGATVRSQGSYVGLWVDGGLWNNLPMTVFANDEGNSPGTLGLVLGNTALGRSGISGLGQFLGALINRFRADEALANAYPSYRRQIIALDTGSIRTAEFSPDPNALRRLQDAAASTTFAYFGTS